MCGINGIYYFGNAFQEMPKEFHHAQVAKMNSAIAHRGPDGDGIYIQYPACLGHRRLSILDLSDNGAQPMFNEDGMVALVFNGEIYNYLELIPDLEKKGHRFKSKSDTEVIIHAYEEYGTDCVKLFNGMWAFALYDARQNLLFASRDRFGVKPFYYYQDAERFVFSSEIKAILQISESSRANLGKVYDYLAYGYKTSNGDTFFEGISELGAATNLIIKGRKVELAKYWDFSRHGGRYQDAANMDQLGGEFTELLQDAVKLRFRSDVPVAILLSGGLDSTAITRVVDDMIERGELGYTEVMAFTAAFPGFKYDESSVVNRFIKTCKHIQLQQVYPGSTQLPSMMETIAYGLGEPVFSATSFAHYSLMKEIRGSGIKVVINGQGADESFCGYDRYFLGYFLLDVLFSRPGDVLTQARAMSDRLGYPYSYILTQLVKAALPRRQASYLRGKYQERVIGCLDPGFVTNNYGYLKDSRSQVFSDRNLERYLKFNIQHYGFNQILHYEDHSSMQHSVEIRSPFIDYRLMEFAFALPTRAKFDMGVTKKIIREQFRGRLPEEVIDNRNKIGFAAPFSLWLKDEAFGQYVQDMLGSASFRSKRIWDAAKVEKVFNNQEHYPLFPYWRILNLELWSRAYGITNL